MDYSTSMILNNGMDSVETWIDLSQDWNIFNRLVL